MLFAFFSEGGFLLGGGPGQRSRFCSSAQAAGGKVCMAVAGVLGRRRMMSVAWNTISAATAPDFSISLDGISAFPEAMSMSIFKGC